MQILTYIRYDFAIFIAIINSTFFQSFVSEKHMPFLSEVFQNTQLIPSKYVEALDLSCCHKIEDVGRISAGH